MTPRTFAGALALGKAFHVEFVGPGIVWRCPSYHPDVAPNEPVHCPYGAKVLHVDTPEEAAQEFRSWWPCADRLTVKVRRYLAPSLLDNMCLTHTGPWEGGSF